MEDTYSSIAEEKIYCMQETEAKLVGDLDTAEAGLRAAAGKLESLQREKFESLQRERVDREFAARESESASKVAREELLQQRGEMQAMVDAKKNMENVNFVGRTTRRV